MAEWGGNDRYTDSAGRERYGTDASQTRQLENNQAKMGEAMGDLFSSLDNFLSVKENLFAFVVVGGMGGFLLFLNETLLQSYGANVDIPLMWNIIIPAIAVLICMVVFRLSKKIMNITGVAILVIMLFTFGLPHFIGNGTLTTDFKLLKGVVNIVEAPLNDVPADSAKTLATLKQGDKLEIIGVTSDGWARVLIHDDTMSGPGLARIFIPRGIHTKAGTAGSGWVRAEQIVIEGEPRLIRQARVISDTLNVRDFSRIQARRPVSYAQDTDTWKYAAKKSDMVQITGEARNGYVPVFVGSGREIFKGFALVDSLFIDDGSGEKAPAALTPPEGETATVTEDWNMRSGRYNSTRYIAKTIRTGERLVILNNDPNAKHTWVNIWFDGEEGWIGRQALQME